MRSLKIIWLFVLAACCAFFASGLSEDAAQTTAPAAPGEGVDTHLWETAEGAHFRSVRALETSEALFGRQEKNMKAAVIDLSTEETVPLDRLFADVDAAQAFLNAYVEENVLPTLNTYLDRSDVLPVPMDNVYFGPSGVTFYYPSEAFSYFSGNGGAVELKYYELAAFLTQDALAAKADGLLFAFPDARPGEPLQSALARLGALTEPDFITDGEIYEVEDASFRGAHLIAPRGAQDDDNAPVQAVRVTRADLKSLITGLSLRADCRRLLGQPDETGVIGASEAEGLRLAPGTYDRYGTLPEVEGYTLTLYFDAIDTLYAAELSR